MRGNEFIRQVHRYAKDHGLSFEWRPDLGKGGHGILILGDRRTVVRNPKDELNRLLKNSFFSNLSVRYGDVPPFFEHVLCLKNGAKPPCITGPRFLLCELKKARRDSFQHPVKTGTMHAMLKQLGLSREDI